jgi:hypothetical protein
MQLLPSSAMEIQQSNDTALARRHKEAPARRFNSGQVTQPTRYWVFSRTGLKSHHNTHTILGFYCRRFSARATTATLGQQFSVEQQHPHSNDFQKASRCEMVYGSRLKCEMTIYLPE